MPVYLFTYHAYRSWMPDRPGGFVQKGKGLQPPNRELAAAYANAANHPPFSFDEDTQQLLIETTLDVCSRRDWRLHEIATETSHLHALVSWKNTTRWQNVRGKIRNICSLELSKKHQQHGRPWFVEGASRKRVRNRRHFERLMTTYLPNHRGLKWFETRGWIKP